MVRLAVAILVALILGYSIAIANFGDLVVLRNAAGQCVAYDPATQQSHVFGSPSGDGRCHLWRYRMWP